MTQPSLTLAAVSETLTEATAQADQDLIGFPTRDLIRLANEFGSASTRLAKVRAMFQQGADAQEGMGVMAYIGLLAVTEHRLLRVEGHLP